MKKWHVICIGTKIIFTTDFTNHDSYKNTIERNIQRPGREKRNYSHTSISIKNIFYNWKRNKDFPKQRTVWEREGNWARKTERTRPSHQASQKWENHTGKRNPHSIWLWKTNTLKSAVTFLLFPFGICLHNKNFISSKKFVQK